MDLDMKTDKAWKDMTVKVPTQSSSIDHSADLSSPLLTPSISPSNAPEKASRARAQKTVSPETSPVSLTPTHSGHIVLKGTAHSDSSHEAHEGSLYDTVHTTLLRSDSKHRSRHLPPTRHRTEVDSVGARSSPPGPNMCDPPGEHLESSGGSYRARYGMSHVMRYALLFINMMLVLASMLLVTSGINLNGEKTAAVFCDECRGISIAPQALGGLLWLLALSGFYAAKTKNVSVLLLYILYIIFLCVAMVALVIASYVLLSVVEGKTGGARIDRAWAALLSSRPSLLCGLQEHLKCSGLRDSCIPGGEGLCPEGCQFNAFPSTCANQIQNTVSQELVAFGIIQTASTVLIFSAVIFAWAISRTPPR